MDEANCDFPRNLTEVPRICPLCGRESTYKLILEAQLDDTRITRKVSCFSCEGSWYDEWCLTKTWMGEEDDSEMS